MIVRPSASSTVNESSVTLTLWANTSRISDSEILMPRPQQANCVLFDHLLNAPDLHAAKAAALVQANRVKPKLPRTVISLHVDVRRLISIGRVKEKPICPGPKNSWQ